MRGGNVCTNKSARHRAGQGAYASCNKGTSFSAVHIVQHGPDRKSPRFYVAQFNEKVFRVGKGSQRTDSRGSPQLGFYPLHPARGGRVKTGLSGFLNSVPRRGSNRTWSRGMVLHQNCQISGLQVKNRRTAKNKQYRYL